MAEPLRSEPPIRPPRPDRSVSARANGTPASPLWLPWPPPDAPEGFQSPACVHRPVSRSTPARTEVLRLPPLVPLFQLPLTLPDWSLSGGTSGADTPAVPAEAPGPLQNPADNEPTRRRVSERLGELIGLVPLLAPLAAAGWYQADLAHGVFNWAYPWALVWPAAIEGGAAYTANLYLRKLIAGHSTISTRIGMMAYAAGSSALLWWHATEGGHPWQAAAGIGGMTVAGVWLWVQRARWLRRKDLQARGLVDAQAPRFNVLRWVLCPIETSRAFRHGVRYGIQDPQAALAAFRVERNQRRVARALRRGRKRAAELRGRAAAEPEEPPTAEVVPEPTEQPEPSPALESASGPRPEVPKSADEEPAAEREPEPSGTPRKARGSDRDAADRKRLEKAYGTGTVPSLKQIMTTLRCGVSKAQRIQRDLRPKAESDTDQESEAVA